MSELNYSVVRDAQAQRIADDLHSQYRYYTGALADVQKATEREMENVAKGWRMDASWIAQASGKATEYQREIETLVRMAKLVGLGNEQIQLALSDAKVWFQTPEEAAEMELAARKVVQIAEMAIISS